MALHSGQQFGNYEIIKLLGKGGMGEVYLARDTTLNREIAIKILSSELVENAEMLSRFLREAKLGASLNHPNICMIYQIGKTNEQVFICMEYVEGFTLRDLISKKPIKLQEALDIAIQIADGLEEARKKNIIHRDIKSANILLTPRQSVKILDFGLAKRLQDTNVYDQSRGETESSLTQDGVVRGTVAYMSPELALGKPADHRSDIFSFGIVLYEMLAGRLPFMGATVFDVIDEILHQTPVPVARFNNSVPPELVSVLNKMLEKDPGSRYQSVHEVWVDLRRIKSESSPGSTAPAGKMQTTGKLQWKVVAASLLITVSAGLGLYYLFHQQKTGLVAGPVIQKERVAIAVLPFQYNGEDPSRDYLGVLVTDGLIASLQAVQDVSVAPYANIREITKTNSIRSIARELDVQWIIKGTVSVNGENTEIALAVISAKGETVWSKMLSGRTIATIDAATKSILSALPVSRMTTREIEQLRTPSVEAYRKYLHARARFEGWDLEDNLDDAVKLYREALSKDPDFAAAHAGLATALIGQFQKRHDPKLLSAASEEAHRALGLDANLPESLLAYGRVLLESGNSIEARDAFSRALELAPGDDAACRSFASMYASLGKNTEAEEMYLRAISLRPGYWMNHYTTGTFKWQFSGDLKGARLHLEKANELHPAGYAPVVMLGNIHLTQGHLPEAETYFRKALELKPNVYAYNNLGLVHYYRGHFDLALRNWQTLLKDAPEKPIYVANVADALRQLGREEEAAVYYGKVIRTFRAALKTNREDDGTRAYLAMALAAIGQCKEATEQTRTVISRHTKSPEMNVYAAITASRCGDLDWAKEIVLGSIAADTLLTIRYDPDLKKIRELPEVKKVMERLPSPG